MSPWSVGRIDVSNVAPSSSVGDASPSNGGTDFFLDVLIDGSYAYAFKGSSFAQRYPSIASFNFSSLGVLTLLDSANPAGSYTSGNNSATSANIVKIGDFIYICTTGTLGAILSWDVSDPSSMAIAQEFTPSLARLHGLWECQGYLIAVSESGTYPTVMVFDPTDPYDIQEVATYSVTDAANNNVEGVAVYGNSLVFYTNALVTNGRRIFCIDISNPLAPTIDYFQNTSPTLFDAPGYVGISNGLWGIASVGRSPALVSAATIGASAFSGVTSRSDITFSGANSTAGMGAYGGSLYTTTRPSAIDATRSLAILNSSLTVIFSQVLSFSGSPTTLTNFLKIKRDSSRIIFMLDTNIWGAALTGL